MKVSLSKTEFFQAAMVGLIRQLTNVLKKRADRYGAEMMDGWGIHIEGACGEAALCKELNIYYTGNIGDLKACDVNNRLRNIEVRTCSRENGRLILHPEDKDESIFVLLVGKAPHFVIKGYILGKDGKKPEFWKDPTGNRPAYFVPQKFLRDISDLKSRKGLL